MASMDIFKGDAFSCLSLTGAVEKIPYQPSYLGTLPGLFAPKPVRTTTVAIEERAGVLSVIQTSERGQSLEQRTSEKRNIRDFRTVRIAKGDRLEASEVQNIRAFGSESELMQVQQEIARRLGGPTGLRAEVELTHENMRLGAVQGIVYDADGTTVLRNWFTEFGVEQDEEIDFALGTDGTDVRRKCTQVVRQTLRALGGVAGTGLQIIGLSSDAFWDDLVGHPKVRDTYLAQQEAKDLRKGVAFESVHFGGIDFVNYRGMDDGTSVSVPANKCKFFPNVPGVFEVAYSPAETFDYVNTPGQPVYSMIVPDEKRNMFVDLEVYSYPLFVCKRPKALQRAKRVA